jgi:hypothetical protein
MGTTDIADDTDEKQRQISGGGFIPPLRRIQSNLPVFIRFFIRGIGAAFVRGLSPLIRGRAPLFCGCG